MLSRFIFCGFGHQIKRKRLMPKDSHLPKDCVKKVLCVYAKVKLLMMEEGIFLVQ